MEGNNNSMSESDRREMLSDFLIDCEVLLKTLNDKLLVCEKAISSKGTIADVDIDAMFRAAHSIKGAASFIGLENIVKLTHEMENILQKIKNKQILMEEKIFNVLFKAFDKLEALFERLKETSFDDGDIEQEIVSFKNVLAFVTESSSNSKNKNDKYWQQYLVETIQNIDDFNKELLNYEKNKDKIDIIDTLFRITHTIKGSSGLLKVSNAHKVAHNMENILNYARSSGQQLDNYWISALFGAIDLIKEIVMSQNDNRPLPDNINKVLDNLNRLNSIIENSNSAIVVSNDQVEEKIKQLITQGNNILKISVQLESDLSMKSMKALLLQEKLARITNIHLMLPSMEVLEKEDFKKDVTIIFLIDDKNNQTDIKEAINIDGVTQFNIEKQSINNSATATATATPTTPPASNSNSNSNSISNSNQHNHLEISTIKVDSNKIDTLLNLSGELVILRAKFSQILHRLRQEKNFDYKNINSIINIFDETTSSLGKMASEIQTSVMQTRMIPIEGIFNRFKRTVRDISHELGKNIELVTRGEDTELDKKIVDSLSEPLTHMIRNAADHGIEDQEERKRAGKAEQGTIYLSASHRGNSICIEVADDGKGIDHNKVLKSAIEKGILTEEKAQTMSKQDILNLIFLPGFSTAAKVTGISGRGVGMDVVKNMINSVNGIVEINTEVGSGTSFLLKIPLTLAIIQALNVIVAKEVYSIPIESVVEILKVHPFDIYSVDGNETVKLRGHALSLIELENVIKVQSDENKRMGIKNIVVITNGQKQVGLVIDDLIGKDEMVIKSLSEHFSHVKGITGASILGDGRVALILDPLAIMREI
ncbi:MAG: chemotaxis protein CheA [Oligoflexia bacterium]|nr:chemotaxis protein CheA [Oligoflexia bacterium]